MTKIYIRKKKINTWLKLKAVSTHYRFSKCKDALTRVAYHDASRVINVGMINVDKASILILSHATVHAPASATTATAIASAADDVVSVGNVA